MTQFGVPYELTGPDGTRAVFNDDSDPDYVGMITELTGLDSAEVRENFSDLVEGDGGVHGNFWYSRRPIVIQGLIRHSSNTDRNNKIGKILRASNAMRADAELVWTPEGSVERRVLVRRQQPTRITGAFNKQFMLALVSANALVESSALHSESVLFNTATSLVVNNAGDHPVPAIVHLDGEITDINEVSNATTGESLDFGGYDLANAFGNYIDINLGLRTVVESVSGGTASIYSQLNFPTTTWWLLQPGNNTISLPAMSGWGTNAGLSVTWRDGWA